MKHTKLIVFLVIFCYAGASAQVMNVRKWRQSERDSLDGGMQLYDEKFYLLALPVFENILNNHPNEEFLKYTYAKCALYRADKHEDAYKYFSEVYERNKKVPGMQYDMALAAHYNYKFDEAMEYANLHSKRASAEGKNEAEVLKRYIGYGKYYFSNPTGAKITNLGAGINTADDEYVPTIVADESRLIFTYLGSKSTGGRQNENLLPDPHGAYMEDIYMAYREGDEFKTAFALDSLNTNGPDAAISMSNDGNILFIYQDIGDGHGDIYESFLMGHTFSKPRKLKGEVNSYSWDGHCSLSPDGQTLYFSSDRAGGYGGRDLYRASLLADSTWGRVINLGDSVNTPYDDDAPFIHSDGVTLFYSSKGRSSMGGYDIFRSVMNQIDSTFKKTENLGYPINSPSDDIYFVLAANGSKGYFSSGKKEGKGMKDIYMVEPNFGGPKPSLYLVKGKVKSGDKGIEASVKVEITSKNNKLFKAMRSNSVTGDYLVTLPPGVSYVITYSYKDRPEQRLNVDAVDLNGYAEKINDVNFEVPASEPVVALAKTDTPPVAPKIPDAPPAEEVKSTLTTATSPTQEIAKNETPPAETTPPVAKNTVITSPEEVVNHVPPAKSEPEKVVTEPSTGTTITPTYTRTTAAVTVSVNNLKEIFGSDETPEKPVTTAKTKTADPFENPIPPGSGSAATNAGRGRKTNSSGVVNFTTMPVTSTPLNLPAAAKEPAPAKGGFVPVNGPQIKAMKFAEKYNAVTADEMEFKVQVAAVKNDRNAVLPNQKVLGKVEKLVLGDGFTRITVGGSFKTLGEAFEHNKKIVKAGQKEGFVIALYKGKRVPFEELEKLGLLK